MYFYASKDYVKIDKKKCSVCGKEDELKFGYCHECYNYYKKVSDKLISNKNVKTELTDEQKKERQITRKKTNKILRRAKLIKDCKCQLCGNKNSETHHIDYVDALFIIFVCKKCHIRIHANRIDKEKYMPIAKMNRQIINDYVAQSVEQSTKSSTGNA